MHLFTFIGATLDLLVDLILPRFVTREVLLLQADDGVEVVGPACLLLLAEEDQPEYDFLGEVRYFNLFGFMIKPKVYEYVLAKGDADDV